MSRTIPSELRRLLFEFRGGRRLHGVEDEDANRGFHLVVCYFLGWAIFMSCLVLPLFAVRKVATEIMMLVLEVAATGSLFLLRRGRTRAARRLFLSVVWCLVELYSTFSGGIRSSGTDMGIAVILATAWLLGLPSALGVAAMTLTLSLAGVLLGLAGHPIPVYFPGVPLVLWAVQLVFIALTIGTVASLLASLRKQISALRDSEERFRSLSDASFEGIMIHENGVILDVNLAFVRLFGYERPDELIGRSGPDLLLTPESRERVRHRINEAAEGVIELSGVRKDGVLVSAENESRAIRHRGRDARLVAWRDITERKRAEREKAKMEAQLLQAQKMEAIGRLTGGIAHDFNNLLTVINGYSNVLRRRLDGRQEGTLAEQIGKAGELAANLTRQLLAFSRMEVAHPELVGLNGIVTESLDMLKGLLGGQIEMNVGLGAAPDEVMADPNQIRQCLMNLVVNARDAMPAGGRLTIETGNADVTQEEMPLISGSAPGPHVRLTVTDSGIGMDEETSRRIFEPFFTTKKQGHGTGLGLSTVYGIVSQWRGGLKVVSEPGKGSQFSIYLPVSRVPPPPVERLDGVEAI